MVDLDQGGRNPQVVRTFLGPSQGWIATDQPSDLQFAANSGSVILPGLKGYMYAREWVTIHDWVVVADQPGNLILDIWRVSLAQFIAGTLPSVSNRLVGIEFPQLSGQIAATSSTLKGWQTVLAQNDVLAVVVNSATLISKFNLTLRCIRNLGPA